MNLKYIEISSIIKDRILTASVRFSNDEWIFNLSHSNSYGVFKLIANITFKKQGSFDFFNSKGSQRVLDKWLDLFKNQCEIYGIYVNRVKKKFGNEEKGDFYQEVLITKIFPKSLSLFRTDPSTFHDPLQLERMYLDPNSLGELPFKVPFPDEHDWNHNGVVLQKHGLYFKDYELALACFINALKKNPSFEPALINKRVILEILGWEDGDVFELFKKNILSKLKIETVKIIEALSETLKLGIQLEKEIKLLDDSTFNRKLSIIIKDDIVVGLGIFNCTEVIPDIIGNLKTLQYLYLYGGRRFSLKYIPESIKMLTALKKLNIHKLKEEYSPDWLEIFVKNLSQKIELTIDIEEGLKNGKKLEKKNFFIEKRKAEEQRIKDERKEKERTLKSKKELEERRMEANRIELQKEKELRTLLKDVETLIKEKKIQQAEDKLDTIVHESKRYHLNILEKKAKDKYKEIKEYQNKLLGKNLQEKDILKAITDPIIKERFLELKELKEERNKKFIETREHVKLPNKFRLSVQELFSQKDPYILRYLLLNINYLLEFSQTEIVQGSLDSIFKALTETFDILRIYESFSGFPDDFFKYYVNKFGHSHNYYVTKYISLNLENSKIPSELNSRFEYWNINIFICETLLGGLPAFYKPNYYKEEAIIDLRNLITLLNKWVQGDFDIKLLNRSLAIPILEKLEKNNVLNITSILKKYLTYDKVFVKTTHSQLAGKKITIYQGEVILIKHLWRKVINPITNKGWVTRKVKTKIILKNVLIVPSFKKLREISKDDVEFKMDRLEVYTSPDNFKENPFEVGDVLYCYGTIREGKMDFVWGGDYDVLKLKS